jgi:acyl-CoA thioester hydrolase
MSTGSITYRGVATAWHCDHVGHLNIAHYVSRFDEAHWPFFAEIGLTPAWLRSQRRGMAAVEQHIRYRREVKAGDVLAIRSRLVAVAAKTITSVHELLDDSSGEICAVERITCALLDLDARRAVAFPDAIAARLRDALHPEEPADDAG